MQPHLKVLSALFFSTIVLTQSVSAADDWPQRPIRLIVPFAPGGGTDIFARVMAPVLTEKLGQQIVVENKPG